MKAFSSYSNSFDVVSTAYLYRFHDNPTTAIAHFLVGLEFTMTQTVGEKKKSQFSVSEEKKYPQISQHQNMVVGSILTLRKINLNYLKLFIKQNISWILKM